ncbi:MAG: metallophosphatase family protein [Bacteroidales bacterium]|nr:metallophosphatase family protein [Bacteroidales bacterium]
MRLLALAAALVPCMLSAQSTITALHPSSEVVPWLEGSRAVYSQWGKPEPAPSLTLLQFSDLHGDTENLERIADFLQAYGSHIEDAIHLGDVVNCYWDDPNPWDLVPRARGILNVVGNHDCWKGHLVWAQSRRPYDATADEAYSLIMEGKDKSLPFISGWGAVRPAGRLCYYYKDYNPQGIRLIVLDCMHYDQAQDKWFSRVLAEALKAGRTVIAAQHLPAQSGLEKLPLGFSDRDYELEPVASPDGSPAFLDTPEGPQMERMSDACFAAVDRFIDAGGTFACWLSGHTHIDMTGHVPGHRRQLQIIVDKAGQKDSYMQEARTRGTVLQDAFNLVTVNPSRGLILVKRIGCNRDHYMRSKSLFTYSYLTGELIASE